MSVDLDLSAIAALDAPGSDVDRYCHHVAERAYGISQDLVPSPGSPGDPYAKGPLKASGRIERGPGSAWDVVYDAGHAIFVELGTRYMNAEPFLRPALLLAVRGR